MSYVTAERVLDSKKVGHRCYEKINGKIREVSYLRKRNGGQRKGESEDR